MAAKGTVVCMEPVLDSPWLEGPRLDGYWLLWTETVELCSIHTRYQTTAANDDASAHKLNDSLC